MVYNNLDRISLMRTLSILDQCEHICPEGKVYIKSVLELELKNISKELLRGKNNE